MASLQSPFTVLATNPRSLSPFPNPSHLVSINARRSHHRLRVSCSGGGGRVDRRNMLLGLGGLYGAGSLISGRKAEAQPIDAPDIAKCDHHGVIEDHKVLNVDCCPPVTDDITDYVLPAFTKLRVRPAAHRVDKTYMEKFNEAIGQMKHLDKTEPHNPWGFTQQANVHCAYCSGPYKQVADPTKQLQVHCSWLFFPFHRWYLYFFERILGKLIGDEDFALPYWNWDNPPGMHMPPMFDIEGTPLYDENRNQSHRGMFKIVDLSYDGHELDPEQLLYNNIATMYNVMIGSGASAMDFMGNPYRAGGDPGGPGSLERGPHNAVHRWAGNPKNPHDEDMGDFYSAGRDPIFYSHHSNVDRMWTVWKTIPADYTKEIFDCDFLNSSFIFYDENKKLVRVKVSDCLDTRAMGYEYQEAYTPWLCRPPLILPMSKFEEIAKGLRKVDEVLPLTLDKTAKVLVSKTTKGKADEVLVVDNIFTDPTLYTKFDVYVNDDEVEPQKLNKAGYAGSYSQLPHGGKSGTTIHTIRLSLRELYESIDIRDEDDAVVVTVIPRSNGQNITIGGIKIIQAKPKSKA